MPQWNCGCANCDAARRGEIAPQLQSSLAVQGARGRWFLINASPDLRRQMELFFSLHPRAGARESQVEAVLLTNADLDHVLGLFLLREGNPLPIHATPAVQETLKLHLGVDRVLNAFCGARWITPPEEKQPLLCADGTASGLSYRAIPLPATAPRYSSDADGAGHSIAYEICDDATHARVLIAPDVAEFTPQLEAALDAADAVFFDGTFWSEDEMLHLPGARSASAMGHLPICTGSLERLSRCGAARKIYLHINNTNPVLAADSNERRAVERAGCTVGSDGMEFTL